MVRCLMKLYSPCLIIYIASECKYSIANGEKVYVPTNPELDVIAVIGLVAVSDLDFLSEDEKKLKHLRRAKEVFVHPNFVRERPFDLGE